LAVGTTGILPVDFRLAGRDARQPHRLEACATDSRRNGFSTELSGFKNEINDVIHVATALILPFSHRETEPPLRIFSIWEKN
jgi:hypothetical protein